MHLHTLTSRDEFAPSGAELYDSEKNCSNSFSWFRLCPIDFALWALITLLICLVFWRIYARSRRVSETPLTGQMPTRSRHKGYKRLTLPYPSRNQFPSDPSPAYDDDYGYEYKSKFDLENSKSTINLPLLKG
uniref:Uncharacterized protein n=1 Tax=Psilocybe cubensis TaxID=181762 RepID=A0A8H7XP41_PSICU